MLAGGLEFDLMRRLCMIGSFTAFGIVTERRKDEKHVPSKWSTGMLQQDRSGAAKRFMEEWHKELTSLWVPQPSLSLTLTSSAALTIV